jgi:hypothetical protein
LARLVEHDPTQADSLQSVPGWCPLQLAKGCALDIPQIRGVQ